VSSLETKSFIIFGQNRIQP